VVSSARVSEPDDPSPPPSSAGLAGTPPPPPPAPATPAPHPPGPLGLVPAAIVGALLLVFLFFGAIAGREATLSENLDRVLHGGAGERKQAAFNLVRQIAENREAELGGQPPPWPLDPGFLPRLREARASVDESDPEIRLVIASLLAQLGDEEGVTGLLELLDLAPGQDPEGAVRFHALATLGSLGDPRAEAACARILRTSDDTGLRIVSAVALQRIPGEEGRGALLSALEDAVLEVRANAAIALAVRGDPAGAGLLRDLLDPEIYRGEQARDARKFTHARRISESRAQAVEALARLKRPEDRAVIERLAREDHDLAAREAAMRALEGWR